MHKGFFVFDFLRRAVELSPEVEIIYGDKKMLCYVYQKIVNLLIVSNLN